MKITTVMTFIVLVGIIMLGFKSLSSDLNTSYNDNQINTSKWDTKYNKIEDVNGSVGKLVDKFQKITDEDAGFFTKIGSGIVAIPYAVILFPLIALEGAATLVTIMTTAAADFGVPPQIVVGFIVLITIFIVAKLLEYFQKTQS